MLPFTFKATHRKTKESEQPQLPKPMFVLGGEEKPNAPARAERKCPRVIKHRLSVTTARNVTCNSLSLSLTHTHTSSRFECFNLRAVQTANNTSHQRDTSHKRPLLWFWSSIHRSCHRHACCSRRLTRNLHEIHSD